MGRFDGGTDLTRWNLKAFRDNLEVMDEGLHLGLHLLAVGEDDLGGVGGDAAFGKAVERLETDVGRLAELLHANDVAGPDVAVIGDRDVELELLVAGVRHVAADIEIDARGAHRWTGDAQCDGVLGGEIADALEAAHPDGIGVEQAFVLLDMGGEGVEEGANLVVDV